MSRKLSKNQEIQVVEGVMVNDEWGYADSATFIKELHNAGYKIVGRGSNDKPETSSFLVETPQPEVVEANLRDELARVVRQRDEKAKALANEERKNSDLRDANGKLRKELDKQYEDILSYSEWLDENGLMAEPGEGDTRTHEKLIEQFHSSMMLKTTLVRKVQ